ncbi:dTDP-4-dehydrorhamnose reductase [Aquibium oceanicum]|uniref:dTDP-4-dehydrorhamnose reductase n=1 Tax=Aquibium oceanicum TaxID=1670800 RepID=A0A1L3SQW1_9HYPH|nr:dTDP-4-dehydrorhamnose reductase [Aquibium oceanicum]APH71817.1 dTDP-4-dehydrorhamnose reductase [Aquibium oceanicum]
MRILVTGSQGQVVSSLVEAAAGRSGIEVVAIGRPELDLADPASVHAAIAAARPDVVVSAAAYTAVDQAEDEPEIAAAINERGAGAVAEAAAKIGAPVIHLSTDYVFSGDGDRPYREDDPTGPVGVYGATKLAGEKAVAAATPRHLILRTAWVYSVYGKNFVKTMLRVAADRDSLTVVADQWGNPTSAHDIADAILTAAERLRSDAAPFGTYHLAGTGDTHWAGFAAHVLDTSRTLGGPWAEVRGITTAEYPTKARRPANSRLSTDRFRDAFGWVAPDWRESSRIVVERLLA